MGMVQGVCGARDDGDQPTLNYDRGAPTSADAKPRKKRRYTPRARACPRCGTSFKPTRKGQKWCSATCRKAVSKQTRRKADKRARRAEPPSWALLDRACACCGKSFKPKCNHQKYCSLKCQRRTARKRQRVRVDMIDSYLIDAQQLGVLNAARAIPPTALASWLADVSSCIRGGERLGIPGAITVRYIAERGLQAAALFIVGAASAWSSGLD